MYGPHSEPCLGGTFSNETPAFVRHCGGNSSPIKPQEVRVSPELRAEHASAKAIVQISSSGPPSTAPAVVLGTACSRVRGVSGAGRG